jgi:RNA polymerase sigma factor (sigma-70 family)
MRPAAREPGESRADSLKRGLVISGWQSLFRRGQSVLVPPHSHRTHVSEILRRIPSNRYRLLAHKPIDDACATDPFKQLVTVETGAEVRRALSRIPVKYREVVILCDLHDLSYAEIGAILRTSIGAVRSRLHHGRQLLRRWLSRPGKATVCQTARSSLRCSRARASAYE